LGALLSSSSRSHRQHTADLHPTRNGTWKNRDHAGPIRSLQSMTDSYDELDTLLRNYLNLSHGC